MVNRLTQGRGKIWKMREGGVVFCDNEKGCFYLVEKRVSAIQNAWFYAGQRVE